MRLSAATLILWLLPLAAQEDRDLQIHFRPGTHSTTLHSAVVRATVDRYHLRARAGQVMQVRIDSAENNAEFDIAKPDGGYLRNAAIREGATGWNGKLPLSGEYVIEVGSTRGNADYTLKVSIR